ncbi:3-oxoacyl-ACP synthase III family protein [Streptomyces natalensis]|uniref:3-oxoacyl-ACP synthase n=1 Tax=Streptomyces natalensis ATCC 27448 TaxID=1240678 RepID=A0A0D7CK21_9ACTN|nr:ketoacyl-ACP synthase III [Streptomyces natalensis]KIZ16185.1 3-oxoacyl-ACP synthase [Streptomyces natalensis ATCC 27448]
MSHEPPTVPRIGVLGMGTYLPGGIRTNHDVAASAGVTPEWITERTGVHTRHVAAPEEAASDLAAAAVRAAVAAAGIDIDQIDVLIAATSTPDELGPSTACRIQALTGARRAVALDVSAACAGWLFAARVAHDWLRGEPGARYAAVVGVEAYSKFLDPTDRGTAVLFADGAAAAVLGTVADDAGFADFRLGSDGTGAHHVLIPAGGSRAPASPATLGGHRHRIHMDGRAVRDFIAEVFPRLVDETLVRNRLRLTDLDAVITHQPNPVLLRSLGDRIGIARERLVIVGDEVGNIGAASAPYALATAAARGLLPQGGRILLAVFGAGVTWGSALLTWTGAPAIRIAPTRTPATHSAPARAPHTVRTSTNTPVMQRSS